VDAADVSVGEANFRDAGLSGDTAELLDATEEFARDEVTARTGTGGDTL
jgi:hypothetical protein